MKSFRLLVCVGVGWVVWGCAQGSDLATIAKDDGQDAAAGAQGGTNSGTGGASGDASAGTAGAGAAGSGGSAGAAAAAGSGGGAGTSGSGGTGAGGAGGGAGASGGGGAAGSGNPCANVTCNTPPANKCQDANALLVYSTSGTCDQGTCTYTSTPTACANGCVNDACAGDPCVGVSCNTPPANVCKDSTHVTVGDSPGSCSGGTCSYTTHDQYCQYGCAQGVCNGDPCLGVTCNTPPASFCKDASYLTVYDVPGTCNGTCSYTSHDAFCAFGCNAGSCKNDPCAGVSCATPPAAYCADANTLRKFASSGTCSGGTCTYAPTDSACQYGCVSGACKNCAIAGDCPSGQYCNSGTCTACLTDQHCGSSCTDCTTSSQICSINGACIQCNTSSQCGAGRWCNASTCTACNDAQHCGTGCVVCSGTTPGCDGTSCVCTSGSCPSNQQCTGGACAVCASDTACGASCTACGGATPKCLAAGSTSSCVQCLADSDCTGGDVCNTTSHTCVAPGCPPPTASCTTSNTGGGNGCANAIVIGRTAAAKSGGWDNSNDNCYTPNSLDVYDQGTHSCWDVDDDVEYRIYMRAGESLTASLSTSWDCYSSNSYWDATLKIYASLGCADTSCASMSKCASDSWSPKISGFVAPTDGWYFIVADGADYFAGEGSYSLNVKLTCNVAGCECP